MDKNKRERKTTPSVTEKLDETGIKEEIRINETLKKTNKTKKHLAILLSSFGGTVSFCVCLVLCKFVYYRKIFNFQKFPET